MLHISIYYCKNKVIQKSSNGYFRSCFLSIPGHGHACITFLIWDELKTYKLCRVTSTPNLYRHLHIFYANSHYVFPLLADLTKTRIWDSNLYMQSHSSIVTWSTMSSIACLLYRTHTWYLVAPLSDPSYFNVNRCYTAWTQKSKRIFLERSKIISYHGLPK